MAGCSRSPMEWAARTGARSLPAPRWRRCSPGFRKAGAGRAAQIVVAPSRAGRQRKGLRDRVGQQIARPLHGDYSGDMCPAVRSRRSFPRGRFALLLDSTRPRNRLLPATIRWSASGAPGLDLRRGGRRSRDAARPHPFARQRHVRRRRNQGPPGPHRRCAPVVLRRFARRGPCRRHGGHRHSQHRPQRRGPRTHRRRKRTRRQRQRQRSTDPNPQRGARRNVPRDAPTNWRKSLLNTPPEAAPSASLASPATVSRPSCAT